MNDIEKSRLHSVFNSWVAGLDPEKVDNNVKIFLMSTFPQMMEEAFPKKESFFEKLRKEKAAAREAAKKKPR